MIVFIAMRVVAAICPRARSSQPSPGTLHQRPVSGASGGSLLASKPGSFLASAEVFGEFATRRFRVTHAFHPLLGRDSELVARHNNWGEDRVHFFGEAVRLVSLPASWTSVEDDDPFRVIAAGRSFFRVTDLRELVRLIGGQTACCGEACAK